MTEREKASRREDALWWRAEQARINEQHRKVREQWAQHPAPVLPPDDDDNDHDDE